MVMGGLLLRKWQGYRWIRAHDGLIESGGVLNEFRSDSMGRERTRDALTSNFSDDSSRWNFPWRNSTSKKGKARLRGPFGVVVLFLCVLFEGSDALIGLINLLGDHPPQRNRDQS